MTNVILCFFSVPIAVRMQPGNLYNTVSGHFYEVSTSAKTHYDREEFCEDIFAESSQNNPRFNLKLFELIISRGLLGSFLKFFSSKPEKVKIS